MKAWQNITISVVLAACLERAMGRPIDNDVWVTQAALVYAFKRQAIPSCNEEARQGERPVEFTPAAVTYLREGRRDAAVRERRVFMVIEQGGYGCDYSLAGSADVYTSDPDETAEPDR